MRTLFSKLRKLKGRSPHELYSRVAQRAYALSERAALRFDGRLPVPPALQSQSFARPFFAGIANAGQTAASLRTIAPRDVTATLERAASIEHGDIPLLGFGMVHVGQQPQWQRDPFANLSAPLVHWSTIPYLDPAIVGDHKVVWEISRHQYFVTLGQAWQLTRDERWPRAFTKYLASWLEGNHPSVGMNWASSLEVSYRAISWLWAMQLMRDATSVSGELKARTMASLQAHGRHLERYLSTYFSPNTHLTGEALGLFYIGTQCPELPQAARWADLGAEILESTVDRQVLPDGVYFEQASQYHRYTIDIYLHYLLLAGVHGRTVSASVPNALHRLFDVLLHLTRADGSIPLIGDDDGGRLVQLDTRLPHEVRSLLATGAVVLGRSDLAWAGRGDDTAMCWMLGADSVGHRDALVRGAPSDTARAFVDGGLYCMRDGWTENSGHAAIDAGPHGALSYGHSHADALAVELSVGGTPLFVDAGTYTYVGAERDAFRVTAAHNTVEVDATSTSTPGSAFRWKSVSHPVMTSWTSEAEFTCFTGQHDAYASLASPAVHARCVLHPTAGVWIVCDDVLSAGLHDVSVRWHCAPGLTVESDLASAGTRALRISDTAGERAVMAMFGGRTGSCGIESGWISGQLGHKSTASVCVWSERTNGNARLASIVIDSAAHYVSAEATVRLRQQVMGAFGALAFQRQSETERGLLLVLVGNGEPIRFAGLELEADIACFELDRVTEQPLSLTAVGVQRAVSNGVSLVSPVAGRKLWMVASNSAVGIGSDSGAHPSAGAMYSWQVRSGVMSRPDHHAAGASRRSVSLPSTV